MYINPKMRNSLYNVDGVEETGKCNGGLVVVLIVLRVSSCHLGENFHGKGKRRN
jgi:hypothetical protein